MNHPIFTKEIHLWLTSPPFPGILTDYVTTQKAIEYGLDYIHTTQTHFLSWKYERRLFVHIDSYDSECYEITLGKCVGTDREIRLGHNIEKMLLNGEFEWFKVS